GEAERRDEADAERDHAHDEPLPQLAQMGEEGHATLVDVLLLDPGRERFPEHQSSETSGAAASRGLITSVTSPRTPVAASAARRLAAVPRRNSSNRFVTSRASTTSAAPKTAAIASSVAKRRCGLS